MTARWWLVFVASLSVVLVAASVATLVADDVTGQITDQERELVKQVYAARKDYQASLERLRSYYVQITHEENRYWVEKELTDFHLALKAPYILDMDLPSATLKSEKNVPQANKMFREALDWMNRTGMDKEQNVKRAEILFQRILRDFPESDKIDEACYYLGEIYSSKYFQMYRRSVAYYERVFLYSPDTNLDARLRAAYVYERNLGNSQRAVALYQEVLAREVDPNQTREARRRLDTLLRR